MTVSSSSSSSPISPDSATTKVVKEQERAASVAAVTTASVLQAKEQSQEMELEVALLTSSTTTTTTNATAAATPVLRWPAQAQAQAKTGPLGSGKQWRQWLKPVLGWFEGLVALGLLILGWQWYTATDPKSRYILPTPAQVWARLVDLPNDPKLLGDLCQTGYETLMGFGLGSLVGLALGWLIAKNRLIERLLNPLIITSQLIPKIALLPLFLLMWGFNSTPNIAIAAVMGFFPVLSNATLAVKSVTAGHRELMAALGAGRTATLFQLELPFALPYLLSGMEVGSILALMGAVVGEYLNPNGGLGATMVVSLNTFQLDKLFAAIVLLTAMGLSLHATLGLLRRVLLRWQRQQNGPQAAKSR